MAPSAEWLQLLRKVFLFSSFTREQLSQIAKKMTLVSYPKGATLCRADDPGDSLFLILSGTIRILKNDSDGGETLAYLNRGDALGEMALLAGEARTHSAVADSTADIAILHKKDFDHLLEKNAAMALHLSRILSGRLASVHRSGGVAPQPAKIFGFVQAMPPDDQILFSINLALSLVEQTRRKVLLFTVANGSGPDLAGRIGLEAPRVTESHIRDGVLEDPRKFDKFVMVHPSGLELVELDINVFNERIGETLYPFFSMLKDAYDMCLVCLPPRVATSAAPMLAECDRLFLVAGPSTDAGDLQELQAAQAALGGKKVERLWLSVQPGTQPTFFPADIRFDWDPSWNRRYAERGTAFFGPDAAAGQRCLDRLARNLGHLVIGFAMGSGAAFGYALIGMLKVMEREGIHPDVIAGTSMGALIGSFYAAGKTPTQLEEIATSITRGRLLRMADPIPPFRTGIVGGKGVLEFLREHLGDRTFSELLLPFSCVATDIQTGKEIVLDRGHVAEAVRASLSLPFFFQPFYTEGRWLVDGGLVNPVPTSIIVSQGANVLISANLTSKAGERRMPRVVGWWRRHLPRMLKGPSIPETMLKTIYIMQYEIAQARSEIAHVVMQIKAHELLWWDLDRAREMVKMGEAAAEEVMPKVKQLLPYYADSCRVRLVRRGRKSY